MPPMNDSFIYSIGPNPYDSSQGDYHTRGNGEWTTKAQNVTDALQVIFSSLQFPGEPVGRKDFVPGISLNGTPDDEVIQVWSSDPETVKRTVAAMGSGYHVHLCGGISGGLELEVKVTEVEKYMQSTKALLAAPDGTTDCSSLSPLGASVARYHEVKHQVQAAAQAQKIEVIRKEWEVKAMKENMQAKVAEMEGQIAVFDAYLHGTRHRVHMLKGKRGTGRYHVFQTRVFLSEEIAILGNFSDMDFTGMEALEKWLVESGHIWKLLPFERCILATRIRQNDKDYKDPFANVWNNIANRQNIIWIRDGENVFHVDVEYNFHNAVFPRRDQFEEARHVVLDHIFKDCFWWDNPKNWHGERLQEGEYDVPGTLCRKPLEQEEPYCSKRIVHKRFKSMDEWLNDPESCTELLMSQVSSEVLDYLRERNKRQMMFAVIVQGIVDNTDYLDIPKGTDMFNWENVDRYMELICDYSHGLAYPKWSEQIAPYLDGKVKAGDWIVAYVEEYVKPIGYGDGVEYSEPNPILFRVTGIAEVTNRENHDGEWVDVKYQRPEVKYYPRKTRFHYSVSWNERAKARKKQPISLVLAHSLFIRVPMPPQYARDILNDRGWKKEHKHLVPLMVNYDKVIQAMKRPVNATVIELKEREQ